MLHLYSEVGIFFAQKYYLRKTEILTSPEFQIQNGGSVPEQEDKAVVLYCSLVLSLLMLIQYFDE